MFARRLGAFDGKRLLDVVRLVDVFVVVFFFIIIINFVGHKPKRSDCRQQVLDGQIARGAASSRHKLLFATRRATGGTAGGDGAAPANRDDAPDGGNAGARYERSALSPDRTKRGN
jgi:hypothetical protein